MPINEKVIDLNHWKKKKAVAQIYAGSGWEVNLDQYHNNDLPAQEDTRYFYMVAPSMSGWLSLIGLDKSDYNAVLRSGENKQPSIKQLQQVSIAVTHIATGKVTPTHDELFHVLAAALEAFATTGTATTVRHFEGNYHTGYLVYNPVENGEPSNNLILRPFAFGVESDNENGPLKREELAEQLLYYIDADYSLHPEYFGTVDIEKYKADFLIQSQ